MRAKLTFLVLSCCLAAAAADVRAQNVYTQSDLMVWPYSTPTEMMAAAYMQVDYSAQVYYNLTLGVNIINETAADSGNCEYGTCWRYEQNSLYDTTQIYANATLVYDPAVEYSTEAFPTLYTNFRSDDGVYFRDYYNFAVFQDGVPVLWPAAGGAFGFLGPGPEVQTTFTQIFLGTLNGLFSGGAMHKVPHHLKAVEDKTLRHDCGDGQPVRVWKFQVVDSDGKNAGRVSIKERFPGRIVTSCSGEEVEPTSCSWGHDYRRGFFDTVSPGGCLPNICGYTIRNNEWIWCPRDRPERKLATMLYEVYTNGILLNGSTNLTGQHIF